MSAPKPQLVAGTEAAPDDPTLIPIPGPFAVAFALAIPEREVRERATGLPFDAYFEAYEPAARAGRVPKFFVPCSFYTSRPGVKAEKVDPSYVRGKLVERFKAWQKKDPSRDELMVHVAKRDGKDTASIEEARELHVRPEPGATVMLYKATGR